MLSPCFGQCMGLRHLFWSCHFCVNKTTINKSSLCVYIPVLRFMCVWHRLERLDLSISEGQEREQKMNWHLLQVLCSPTEPGYGCDVITWTEWRCQCVRLSLSTAFIPLPDYQRASRWVLEQGRCGTPNLGVVKLNLSTVYNPDTWNRHCYLHILHDKEVFFGWSC